MPDKTGNQFKFWQELKRRKVVRVITLYSAAAFVIIELINNITEPLSLPEWVPTLVIVLLSIGFLFTIVMSWIFDITPEGVQKTQPVKQVKIEAAPVTSNNWKIATYVSVVILIGLLIINILGVRDRSENLEELEKSIAVLPFANLSEEKGNEHFVDGLVEDLLNRISVIEELKVISRTSSEMFRVRGVKSVSEIAKELGVSYIVEGSVQRYGDKARINVQLIDAINDNHIWADNYDRDIVDVFKTQSEIAMQVTFELNTILTSKQKTHILDNKTKDVKAFELYQMGRFYWNKRTGEDYKRSVEYFEKAIATDPDYGLAYAGLADSYFLMSIQGWIDRQEGRDRAERLALKALELDKNLSEAYTVLGVIYDYIDYDWENATIAYKRALELNPNYSTAHQYYSEHLSIIGQHKKARMHINKAIQLDPLSFVIRYVSAHFYYHQGQFNDALAEIKKCDELQENHPWTFGYEFRIYWHLGEEEKAYNALRKLMEVKAEYDLNIADDIYKSSGFNAVLKWKIGIDITDTQPSGLPFVTLSLASSFGMIGDYESALEVLEKPGISNEISPGMSYNIDFTNFSNHPRFIALLKKMNL